MIDTFLAAAEGDSSEHSLVSEHASTLVTSMLKNSMVEEMPSMVWLMAPLQPSVLMLVSLLTESTNCSLAILGRSSKHYTL